MDIDSVMKDIRCAKAYQEGVGAFLDGQRSTEKNPYPYDSDRRSEFMQWRNGLLDSMTKLR